MDIHVWNDPPQGWKVGNTLVLPRHAYTSEEAWLSHFEATFPAKAEKMREYSKQHGWNEWAHRRNWTSACLGWLRKNAKPNVAYPTNPSDKLGTK